MIFHRHFITLILMLLLPLLFSACESKAINTHDTISTVDTTPPFLTLNGKVKITLEQNQSYIEAGATATDERDANVNVTITDNVDMSTIGTYNIVYKAQDKAGNEAITTRVVTVVARILVSMRLDSNVAILNVGEKAELTVMATYSDSTMQVLDANIEWIITPMLYGINIDKNILTATRDGSIKIQAKVGALLSNTSNLTITWIVNGHTLPPAPDLVENDATLGGIDSNSNGVRDDVKRNIYATYPVRLHRGVANA